MTKSMNSTQSTFSKKRARTLAEGADKYALYERAVQDPPSTRELIDDIYKSRRKRLPRTLREDFCGTAALCVEWVSSCKNRAALGIDIDPAPLRYARRNKLPALSEAQARRLQLVQQDVLVPHTGNHDVLVAFNFSYWIFHKRSDLLRYFANAHSSLNRKGLFLLDLHGGPDAQFQLEEETEHDDFTYIWQQEMFDPIRSATRCHISFSFPDDSRLEQAFSYQWRLWNLGELRDILHEAGFEKVETWWEGDDDILRPSESAVNNISWVAYLAAWKE